MTSPPAMTRTVPYPTPWDALAAELLGAERHMAILLAANPLLAVRAECPAGATVVVPELPPPAPAVVPDSLPPWMRNAR